MAVSPPLPGMLHIPLVYTRAFALVSHVSVATVVSLYRMMRVEGGITSQRSWQPPKRTK